MRSEQLSGVHGRQRAALFQDLRVASLLLFGGSLLIRLVGLARVPWTDEMYTVLAAHGWLSEGVPVIGDGIYDRAEWFTVLVGLFFKTFGESLLVARLPALIAGSLLVVAIYVWTRSIAGNLAAWIAAAFMALSPLAIQLSQFARFYAIFGLLFWLGAIGTYALVERRFSVARTLCIAAGVIGCFLAALHLQVLTLMGLAAIALWLSADKGLPWIMSRSHRPSGWIALLAVGAATIVSAVALFESGVAERLIHGYRFAPLHDAEQQNQIWFYHLQLVERYPSLWPVFPFFAVLAISVRHGPSLFCLAVFIFVFVTLSFGGMKHLQYLYFVMPFLFVIWGIGLAAVVHPLARWVSATTDRLLSTVVPKLPRQPARLCIIGAGLLFLIVANGAPARTLLKPFGVGLRGDAVLVDWSAATNVLAPWLSNVAVVLSTVDVQTLYFIGRLDLVVNASRPTEYGGNEFSRDPRTGKIVVSRPESLNLIIDCFGSGLFVADPVTWQSTWALPRATARVIEARMTQIETPPALELVAFYWRHPEDHASPAACATLPDPEGAAAQARRSP